MSSMQSTPPMPLDDQAPLVCKVTPWYFRRMAGLAGMLILMGLWFLYDWKVGYHKDNAIADKKDWFENVLLKGYDEAVAAKRLDAWVTETEAKGLPAGKDGEPPRWVSYAAAHGWDEKPHRWTQEEINGQFWWGTCTAGLGVVVGLITLFNRNKKLLADSRSWTTDGGKTIRFDQVHRVDKRKWDNKGLAYVWYRETPEGPEKKAVLDDLKFAGTEQILTRLLAAFKGELIEKISDESGDENDSSPAQS